MDQIPVEEFRTFDEWSQDGYKIIKGSKATWFDGKPMFARRQVTKNPPRTPRVARGYSGPDWDEDMDGHYGMYDPSDFH